MKHSFKRSLASSCHDVFCVCVCVCMIGGGFPKLYNIMQGLLNFFFIFIIISEV